MSAAENEHARRTAGRAAPGSWSLGVSVMIAVEVLLLIVVLVRNRRERLCLCCSPAAGDRLVHRRVLACEAIACASNRAAQAGLVGLLHATGMLPAPVRQHHLVALATWPPVLPARAVKGDLCGVDEDKVSASR